MRSEESTRNPTDSIILLNMTPRGNRVSLLSIPRDVFIDTPGYGNRRIGSINVLGEQEAEGQGIDLVRTSINNNFLIRVDNYILLDLDDFVALVDAVGGVDINVPKEIIDDHYETKDGDLITLTFSPGWQHMDGMRALQYARVRGSDDDYHRAARQQQIMNAFANKLSDPRSLTNWPHAWQAFWTNAETDLNWVDIMRIGPGLLLGWRNRTQRVLAEDDLFAVRAGFWVPNYELINPWIEEHFD
jgi:LCP family protein required for cell wall assembly